MKIIVQNGKVKVDDFEKLMNEIAEGIMEKIPNCGELLEQIEEAYISHVELELTFKIEGQEGLQQMTVKHHDNPELMTVIVEIDEDGNIVQHHDNNDESLFSQSLVDMMNYEGSQVFQGIMSDMDTEVVIPVQSVQVKDFKIAISVAKRDEKTVWVQFFKDELLIQEGVIHLTEEQSVTDVVESYSKLRTE